MADDVEKEVSKSIGEEVESETSREPSYRFITDARIMVSKHRGKLWKSRIDQGITRVSDFEEAWNEAICYYENDQSEHRRSAEGKLTKDSRISDRPKETENVVFANVTALVPRIYSQNPVVEITTNNGREKDAQLFEKLLKVVASRKHAPGVGMKNKVKRAIVIVSLTNLVWSKVSYNLLSESRETAFQDLQVLAKKLEEAEDKKEIEEIEGAIRAIEEVFDILKPSGPELKIIGPGRLCVDPTVEEPDFSDANWMAELVFIPTQVLRAKFMQKDKEGNDVLTFAPTHIVKAGCEADDDIDNFSLFDNNDPKQYGYNDKESFDKAKMTKCWYVWDKTTQRVELYMDNDWKWPVWVWPDPLKLEGFFPFDPLSFVIPARGAYAKGEVSYYLDQQDAINEINEAERLARRWARWNIFYNANVIDETTFQKVMEGGASKSGFGLNLPEGQKLTDHIYAMPLPSAQFGSLFDKNGKYAAIDRISSVNDIARGQQYKTNTTNKAIAQYSSSQGISLDDKVDAIEEWLNSIYWKILQLCLMNMTPEQVVSLVGEEGQAWQVMSPEQIRAGVSIRIQSGTTIKPTSDAKKQEAVNMMQALGQFSSASPVALLIALRVAERAFDELVINPQDWQMLQQAIEAAMQPPGAAAAPAGGGGEPNVEQILSEMTKEQKAQAVALMQQGMDPMQAIEQVRGPVQ